MRALKVTDLLQVSWVMLYRATQIIQDLWTSSSLAVSIVSNLVVQPPCVTYDRFLRKALVEIIWCWIPTTISILSFIRAVMLVSSRSNLLGCWHVHQPSAMKLWLRPGLVLKSTESISIRSSQPNKKTAIIEVNNENFFLVFIFCQIYCLNFIYYTQLLLFSPMNAIASHMKNEWSKLIHGKNYYMCKLEKRLLSDQ